jgi:hypothetical protein
MTFLENQLKGVQFYRNLKKLSASVECDYSTLSVFGTGEEQLADCVFLDYDTWWYCSHVCGNRNCSWF